MHGKSLIIHASEDDGKTDPSDKTGDCITWEAGHPQDIDQVGYRYGTFFYFKLTAPKKDYEVKKDIEP